MFTASNEIVMSVQSHPYEREDPQLPETNTMDTQHVQQMYQLTN